MGWMKKKSGTGNNKPALGKILRGGPKSKATSTNNNKSKISSSNKYPLRRNIDGGIPEDVSYSRHTYPPRKQERRSFGSARRIGSSSSSSSSRRDNEEYEEYDFDDEGYHHIDGGRGGYNDNGNRQGTITAAAARSNDYSRSNIIRSGPNARSSSGLNAIRSNTRSEDSDDYNDYYRNRPRSHGNTNSKTHGRDVKNYRNTKKNRHDDRRNDDDDDDDDDSFLEDGKTTGSVDDELLCAAGCNVPTLTEVQEEVTGTYADLARSLFQVSTACILREHEIDGMVDKVRNVKIDPDSSVGGTADNNGKGGRRGNNNGRNNAGKNGGRHQRKKNQYRDDERDDEEETHNHHLVNRRIEDESVLVLPLPGVGNKNKNKNNNNKKRNNEDPKSRRSVIEPYCEPYNDLSVVEEASLEDETTLGDVPNNDTMLDTVLDNVPEEQESFWTQTWNDIFGSGSVHEGGDEDNALLEESFGTSFSV